MLGNIKPFQCSSHVGNTKVHESAEQAAMAAVSGSRAVAAIRLEPAAPEFECVRVGKQLCGSRAHPEASVGLNLQAAAKDSMAPTCGWRQADRRISSHVGSSPVGQLVVAIGSQGRTLSPSPSLRIASARWSAAGSSAE